MIHNPWNNQTCAALQQIAQTKDTDDLLDISDAYWDDGSAGDCIDAIGSALETGQLSPIGTPIWLLYIGETALYFVGDEASIRTRLSQI